jgi:hypothetical protein
MKHTHTLYVEDCKYYYQMVDYMVVTISKKRCLATLIMSKTLCKARGYFFFGYSELHK